jgi:hypothetical protein
MANFSSDADLLAYEPNVFFDLPFASQRRLRVTDGALAGVTLTSAAGGLSILAEGDVLVISASAGEAAVGIVAAVVDDHTVTLADAVALSATSSLAVEARTLRPQATIVHEELMRAIGIDPDDSGELLDESSIVSVSLMKRLECLGTLSRAYAAAIALAGDNDAVSGKAAAYHQRFQWALNAAQVLIDADGDGEADVWRSPGVARLTRV